MKKTIISKTLILAIVGFIGIQTSSPKANAGLMVLGASIGNPVLAIPMLMAGVVLSGSAISSIYENGFTTRNSLMLVFGLLALDGKNSSLAFQEVSGEMAEGLNLPTNAVAEFNRERHAINAFNQSVTYQAIENNRLSPEELAIARKDYQEIFSPNARLVAETIAKQALRELQR